MTFDHARVLKTRQIGLAVCDEAILSPDRILAAVFQCGPEAIDMTPEDVILAGRKAFVPFARGMGSDGRVIIVAHSAGFDIGEQHAYDEMRFADGKLTAWIHVGRWSKGDRLTIDTPPHFAADDATFHGQQPLIGREFTLGGDTYRLTDIGMGQFGQTIIAQAV
jgi:hypothetical protein